MSTEVRWRRGTTAQHASFVGALGEITVDTDKKVIVTHDGVTAGGFPGSTGASVEGKANSGANSDITSLSGLTTPLSLLQGGTGQTTAVGIRTAIGAAVAGPLGASGITGAAASGANNDITSLTALTAGGLPNNSVLTADIADANVTPAKLSEKITLGTPTVTTSGTSVDITGIPSWARRVSINFETVSTTANNNYLVQLGTASGIETTGYVSQCRAAAVTNAFIVVDAPAAGNFAHGRVVLEILNSTTNVWTESGVMMLASTAIYPSAGSKALAGVLDRIRLTTTGGVDTFDSGSINIIYE